MGGGCKDGRFIVEGDINVFVQCHRVGGDVDEVKVVVTQLGVGVHHPIDGKSMSTGSGNKTENISLEPNEQNTQQILGTS